MTTCIDHLRAQKRRPELRWADLSEREARGARLARSTNENDVAPDDALAARELVQKLLERLKPEDRLVIQYLDLEQKSIAEISALTGWNQTLRQGAGLPRETEVATSYTANLQKVNGDE